jgi:hypothetical protein
MANSEIDELRDDVERREKALGANRRGARYFAAYVSIAHRFRRELDSERDVLMSQAAALTLAERLAAQGI